MGAPQNHAQGVDGLLFAVQAGTGAWWWNPDVPPPADFTAEAEATLAEGDGPAAAFALAQRRVAEVAALLSLYATREAQRVKESGKVEVRVGAFGVPGARLHLAELAHGALAQAATILRELESAHLAPQSPASTTAFQAWPDELREGLAECIP